MRTIEENRSALSRSITVRFSRTLFSEQSIIKACYWLTRDYCCELNKDDLGSGAIEVNISTRDQNVDCDLVAAKALLLQSVEDFELRERINVHTSGIRDLLLAKAFSESGVLEDLPGGVFGDRIENEKPGGMFSILSNR